MIKQFFGGNIEAKRRVVAICGRIELLGQGVGKRIGHNMPFIDGSFFFFHWDRLTLTHASQMINVRGGRAWQSLLGWFLRHTQEYSLLCWEGSPGKYLCEN